MTRIDELIAAIQRLGISEHFAFGPLKNGRCAFAGGGSVSRAERDEVLRRMAPRARPALDAQAAARNRALRAAESRR